MRLNLQKCVGCRACEIACSAGHNAEFNPRRARIQVDFAHPLPATPRFCRQCKNAPCVAICSQGALIQGNPVILDQTLCNGCGKCIVACPFKAIFLDPVEKKAIKCNSCPEQWCILFCSSKAIYS
ncbi:MAG: 4Fe-4S dicluster domain-containing protein [Eubacteriales bacterium]